MPSNGLLQRDFPLAMRFRQDLGVMENLELTAELGVVLLQAVVPVRAGREDLLDPVAFHDLDVRWPGW